MCIPVQDGGVEVHWPGATHSILDPPCSSWPSPQLKRQIIPRGWLVMGESNEDGDRLQFIWTPDGISGEGHSIAEKKNQRKIKCRNVKM